MREGSIRRDNPKCLCEGDVLQSGEDPEGTFQAEGTASPKVGETAVLVELKRSESRSAQRRWRRRRRRGDNRAPPGCRNVCLCRELTRRALFTSDFCS